MKNVHLIDHQSALEDLCRAVGGDDGDGALMLDTEFMRVNTYYPQLCLVQVAAGETVACVDALRCDSLAPLGALLDERRVKVMHSCRQDLEILHLTFGRAPSPVFDTQIAATAAGHGEQVGYASLVHMLLDVQLEKGAQRTDWSRRPLSDAQVRYALDDVRHLAAVHARLRDDLQKSGRLAWVEEDCAALDDDAMHDMNATDAWMRGRGVRMGAGLGAQQQQVLKSLAEWREDAARRADRPREWIVDNSALVAMARHTPRTVKKLTKLNVLPPRTLRRRGDAIVRAVQKGLLAEPMKVWRTEERMSAEQKELFARCREFLIAHCEQHRVAVSLVATADDLKSFARGRRESPLLRGWRYAFAGRRMEQMI